MKTLTPLEKPATCSLSDEALSRRIAWIRSEILPHFLRERKLAGKTVWELEEAPGLADKLDHWSELERRCCADSVFERVPSERAGELRFEIRSQAAPRGAGRDSRGSAVSACSVLGVCCGLPLFATALLNGAAAASLARFDRAWAIGLGVIALAAWRRRRARPSDCGCSQAGA